MNMLIAGRDTVRRSLEPRHGHSQCRDSQTAATLTFTMYMLSQHPNVLTRLRNEILRVVGPMKIPTYDDIRSLQYLRAVINGEHEHFILLFPSQR